LSELNFRLEGVVKAREDYEDFFGPLDLILSLLSKNKIEIKDIKISEILDQYLAHLKLMEEMDLEIASEFVAMASHLVYIKTRMLLALDDEETRAEMEKLIKSLEERSQMEEYRRMVLGSKYLGTRTEIGRSIYVKQPELLEKDTEYRYTHVASELVQAFGELRIRSKRKLPPPLSAFRGIVGHEMFPVSAKMNEILQRLIFRPVERFRVLLEGCKTRSEVVAVFLAVLELCRNGNVGIETADGDAEITALEFENKIMERAN